MGIHVVGLDLGMRSIKMIGLDTSSRPRIEFFDEEELPTEGVDYLSSPDAPTGSTSPGAAGDEESDASDSTAETSDSSSPATDETPSETDDGPDDEVDGGPDREVLTVWQRALDDLLSRHEFRDDTVFVTYLPEGRAISIHQDVPFSDPRKVESILPDLLEDRLPLDPDDIVYDFEVLAGGGDDNTAVVGVGRKPAVREFLDALDDCTIDPAVLGIPELMLRYVAEAACPVDSETPAILDLGHAHTRVLVLADGAPVLAKSIQKGGGDVIRSVADEFELSAEEAEQTLHESGGIVDSTAATPDDRAMSDTIAASLDPLIRELRRHFQSLYAGSGIQIDRIYLCGGLSQIDNLDGHIADQFDVPTRLLPVESAVDTGPVMPRRLREAALPVALALQQPRDRGGERLLNLRTDEFAFRGHSSYLRSQFLKVGAVAALLFALVCGALFARKIELEARRTATRRAIEKQTKELFGAPASTTSAIQKKVAGGPATTRPFVPRMSAYQLFYKMMTTIPEDLELNLDRLDIDTDRNVIQMSGTTKGPQMVDRLVSAFDEVDCLKNINKKPVKVRSDQETHFRLEITSSCS